MKEDSGKWQCKSIQGKTIHIELVEGTLSITIDDNAHSISFNELFASYNPLNQISLEDQVEIMHITSTSGDRTLEGKALHCSEFWKSIPLTNFTETSYPYETKVSDTYKWMLHVSAYGLAYTDISGMYGYPGTIYYQTLADFWFYGPLMPVPDLSLRNSLIDQIKESVGQSGFTFLASHFPLLSYPEFISPPEWVDGDYIVSDFVILRSYGVEYGRQNFHDGLIFLNFASYEYCLTRSDLTGHILTPEIIASINENF